MKSMLYFTIVVLSFTSSQSAPGRYSNKMFEGELTAWLTELLAPLDPATVTQLTVPISLDAIEMRLQMNNSNFEGFSVLEVTLFEPPMPFISNQFKFVSVIDALKVDSNNYALQGVSNSNNVDIAGSMWLSLQQLRTEFVFEADVFDMDSMLVCIKYRSFHVELSVDSVQGELEQAPQITEHIDFYGRLFVEEIEAYINENWEWFENQLNSIYCSSKRTVQDNNEIKSSLHK